ncbi:MAG TPA: trehalase family glycosidase [Bryobacteraceae bacterium]|jgi:alpha,alpha-trehalase|nr:trehalase family glycosidase [Bryobacteraceae bacterium]
MAILSKGTVALQAAPKGDEPILKYIKRTWAVLARSDRTLATSAVDPKFQPEPDGRWPVYISATEDRARIEARLRRDIPPDDLRLIDLRTLPPGQAPIPGLLYLPRPYVVPGGRFNEVYGWDSYFIVRGLLRDGLVTQAKAMVDDFLYEIRNYGKILNANRAYYLTRSQPPFLTGMILAVYRRTHSQEWIVEAMPAIETYYRYWTSEPHLTNSTGLARYFDLGDGPAPEVISSEREPGGFTHYDRVLQYFRTHGVDDYDISQYYDAKTNRLKPLFYKGDRSMRESGFDPSGRFGPFSVDIIHYNPVCLNSLLYLMESETAELFQNIPDKAGDTAIWRERSRERAALINKLMWNEQDGLYEDYDFARRRMRRYPFLATFYPLWAGIASQQQAARVAANLPLFERAGGLQTSTNESGDQWDAPFGWAPLQLIAVEGLRRYGYYPEADRVSGKFLSMVAEQYYSRGTILEKYDVVRRSAELNREIRFGYHSNEAGFGWTNAVFSLLLDGLPQEQRERILTGQK